MQMLFIVWRASGMGGERRGHIPEPHHTDHMWWLMHTSSNNNKHSMNDHMQYLHKCQDVIQLNKHPFKGDITVHQAALLPV